jgi:hypothetical protein
MVHMKVKDGMTAAQHNTILAQMEECLLIDPVELLIVSNGSLWPLGWREVQFALRNRVTNSSVASALLVLFLAFKWLETPSKRRPDQAV